MNANRYVILDSFRGVLLIIMILYHAIWDLVYIFGFHMPWFESEVAYIWQQAGCWGFILLSGFCWSLSRKKWKRGLTVFGASLVITIVTMIAMPENIILFGVLSAIGTAMLVMIPLDSWLQKLNPYIGALLTFGAFIITRNINSGTLGFESWEILTLPESWYANLFTAYLGFPAKDFWSSDYFSVFPWLFLYQTGYFLYHIVKRNDLWKYFTGPDIKPLEFLGRHSLLIYMLHQPVVYGILYILCKFSY